MLSARPDRMFTYFDHDNAILRDLLRYLFYTLMQRVDQRNVCVRLLLHENFQTLIPSGHSSLIKSSRIGKVAVNCLCFLYMSFDVWKHLINNNGGYIGYHKPLV